ncbi:MAG TPA: VOC family protein [Acetivibrio sp.]|uniref:VOC family protein n=1 Tax=Acetivibrio sp. TaxID=1872092 RepID=UPI002BB1A281|nr:VOC family protein [Acetivibrio sp.]HOM01303.1 VOC family protein [Acetivibrio sp.]
MRIHHLGYAVKNMEASVEEFLKIGYEKLGETVADKTRKVLIQFMKLGDYCIELVSPMDAASSINGIITKSGNTPYHICYSVGNIDDAVVRLKNEGYVLMESPSCAVAINSSKVAFLYNRNMGIIELVEENPNSK